MNRTNKQLEIIQNCNVLFQFNNFNSRINIRISININPFRMCTIQFNINYQYFINYLYRLWYQQYQLSHALSFNNIHEQNNNSNIVTRFHHHAFILPNMQYIMHHRRINHETYDSLSSSSDNEFTSESMPGLLEVNYDSDSSNKENIDPNIQLIDQELEVID